MTDSQSYPCPGPLYQAKHNTFMNRLFALHTALTASGIPFRAVSYVRTFSEQARLYASGRTTPGPIRTNAKPGFSPHNYGLARDYMLFRSGVPVNDPSDPLWLDFEAVVQSVGLMTGRNFKGLCDAGHVQLKTWRQAVQWKP